MAKDGRTEIDEPRLLATNRRIDALDARVQGMEPRLDRHPLLRSRYRIETEAAANPNVGTPGTMWVLTATGAVETADLGVVGGDGAFVFAMPGYYEVHGMVFVTPSATHQQLVINRHRNGITGRVLGVTSTATRAGNRVVAGYFNWQFQFQEGDTATIVTEQGDAAGTMTPYIDASQVMSWIEFVYRSHV